MPAVRRRHVMCRTGFTPAVAELSCAAGEACAHVGVSEGEDRSFLVDTFRHNELEMSVSVLGDTEVGHFACRRIELCEIAAACLSVEYIHDLHGGLFLGDCSVA